MFNLNSRKKIPSLGEKIRYCNEQACKLSSEMAEFTSNKIIKFILRSLSLPREILGLSSLIYL